MAEPKSTKEQAHYKSPAPAGAGKCRFCTMWRQGFCTAVKGEISPGATCDYFERRGK